MSSYMIGLLESATNVYRGNPYHLALGFAPLPNPNPIGCTRSYGHPSLAACYTALENLPHGELPGIFTTRPREVTNNYITVPQRHVDSAEYPACAITVDLDGSSKKDVFVSVPWNQIRNITSHIIETCVKGSVLGGWETFGIQNAFNAVLDPSFFTARNDPASSHVGIVDPDGTIGSVGFPEGANNDPPTYNIPSYMVITVSSPRSRRMRDKIDFLVSLNLREYLKQKYESTKDHNVMAAAARATNSLGHQFVSSLMTYDHPRWWEFNVGPDTPEPTNVKYDCDAKLGKPGLGGCEVLLYEFVRGGPVVLDPAKGPLIKTSGSCAIGISSKERQVTSWDILRTVAETLIMTCVASPIATAAGGTAIAKPIGGRRKRDGLSAFPFTRRDSATTFLPSSIEMSVYLQPPFPGPADQTCPWKVAASHEGDVRQCPATSPFDPPRRNLLSDEIVVHDGSVTETINATTVEISSGNFSNVVVGNMTGLLEELASGSSTTTSIPHLNTSAPSLAAPVSASSSTP